MGKWFPRWIVLALWAITGCSQDGTYRLHLVFPDDEARQSVTAIDVWVFAPGGATCEQLVSGEVSPETLTELARLALKNEI